MNENRCVCCGEIIPEGRMVCLRCEIRSYTDEQLYVMRSRGYGKSFYKELVERWKESNGSKN